MASTLTHSTTLKRHELRRVFAKNRGAAAQIARELELQESTISKWLHGKTDSARINKAIQAKAQELLKQEAASRAA